MMYKQSLRIILLYLLCSNAHQITAGYTFADFNNLLFTRIFICDTKNTEAWKPQLGRKSVVRFPGFKLVTKERYNADHSNIISQCRASLIPIEILATYLVIKSTSVTYNYFKNYKS